MQDDTVKREENVTSVIISAPVQTLVYGGDRFLAANIETIRAMAANTSKQAEKYRVQAHVVVSELNPCQEDNYWVGNASLSWGGAEKQGFQLLRNAMRCRFWDEWPAFFYGFNQYFFNKNVEEATKAINLAAERSKKNAAAFRTFAIMLKAGKINNTHMAIKMLENEREKAESEKLKEMLQKRITRLEGLQTLRIAQERFEKRFKRPLRQPQELLDSGILKAFPNDPLQLGYDFRDHSFHLHTRKVQ